MGPAQLLSQQLPHWTPTLGRVYLEETLRREGRFSAQLERDAGDLQKVLGLGVKEAREMRDDLVTKAYRCGPCRAALPGPCVWAVPRGTRAHEQGQDVGRVVAGACAGHACACSADSSSARLHAAPIEAENSYAADELRNAWRDTLLLQ